MLSQLLALQIALTDAADAIEQAISTKASEYAETVSSIPTPAMKPVDATLPASAWPPIPNVGAFGYEVNGPHGPHEIFGWYNKAADSSGYTCGTYWPFNGGYVTAAHVHEGNNGELPPFVDPAAKVVTRPGSVKYSDAEGNYVTGYDVTFIGVDFSKPAPPEVKVGQRVLVEGVIANTHFLTAFYGTVMMLRDNQRGEGGPVTAIIRQDDGSYQIAGGASGGRISLVNGDGTFTPIMLNQASAGGNVDSDGDGDDDEHMDGALLRRAYLAARQEALTGTLMAGVN